MTRDALTSLRSYRSAPEHLIVGLMTGTSADAVDAVLVRLKGEGLAAKHEVLAELERPLADDLRDEVLAVVGAKTLEPERLMRLDAELGELYAEAVSEVCDQAGVAVGKLAAIGSHGQTVRHIPRSGGGGRALTFSAGFGRDARRAHGRHGRE